MDCWDNVDPPFNNEVISKLFVNSLKTKNKQRRDTLFKEDNVTE